MCKEQNGDKALKKFAVVVSVYNEAEGLRAFSALLFDVLNKMKISFEVIFVNDGSRDESADIIDDIVEVNTGSCKAIHFSRNFGHEAAMIAGIDYANAEAIVCMDADIQHPPESLPEMYQKHCEGVDIINMVRKENDDNGFLKGLFSRTFYRMMNRISPVKLVENASDFFLISHRVAEVLRNDFRERNRFLRGFIQIVGFSKDTLEFHAGSRQFGKSKYSFFKLVRLSFNAIVSFSRVPLHLGMIAGIIFAIFTLIVGVYSIIMHIIGTPPPGYTTLVVLVSFAFSIQFFLIGFIGMYVGYNFEESKRRPLYIVKEFNEPKAQEAVDK